MTTKKKWERRATSIFYRYAFATFAPIIITNIQCSSNKQKHRIGGGRERKRFCYIFQLIKMQRLFNGVN